MKSLFATHTFCLRTALATLLLFGASSAWAQQEKKSLSLSLAEAQQYAMEHNYSVENASLDVKKAEAAKWETFSTMLPQVKGSFDYSSMCGYKMSLSGMSIAMNPYGTFGLTASVAVTAQQVMGTLMNDIAVKMSDISRRQTEQETRSNVKNTYVSILVMEETLGLLDSSVANLQRLLDITVSSVRVGAAEQVDADKLAVQVASLRSSINTTRNTLALMYNTLILQLGAEVDAVIELTTPLAEIVNIENAVGLSSREFDLEKNYTYQMLQENEKLSKKQLTLAWLAFAPTLSAYYQYSYKTYFGKDEGFNMTPPNMIGAGISLPIFQSGSRIAAIKEAKIAHQETLNSKRQAEDGLKVQYKQLCYDLVSAIEKYNIQDENLKVTKRVFDNVSEKYKFGRASTLEVTNASSEIINAQTNYIQAVMSVISAQVALEDMQHSDN